MLNYNLNINSPLQQAKKNEDVRPPIYWDYHSFTSASDNTDLNENSYGSMSINAVNTNCTNVTIDGGNTFQTDAQSSVTASITGSNWPTTGSVTMSLNTFGISYDPVTPNVFYGAAISASAAQIIANPNITGSKLDNKFLAIEFIRFYTSGSIIHMKGNVSNAAINWLAFQNPATASSNLNVTFSIDKEGTTNEVLSYPNLSSSGVIYNNYAFNQTASISCASIPFFTGSTYVYLELTMEIPQTSTNLTSITSASLLTSSFVAEEVYPRYDITASATAYKTEQINLVLVGGGAGGRKGLSTGAGSGAGGGGGGSIFTGSFAIPSGQPYNIIVGKAGTGEWKEQVPPYGIDTNITASNGTATILSGYTDVFDTKQTLFISASGGLTGSSGILTGPTSQGGNGGNSGNLKYNIATTPFLTINAATGGFGLPVGTGSGLAGGGGAGSYTNGGNAVAANGNGGVGGTSIYSGFGGGGGGGAAKAAGEDVKFGGLGNDGGGNGGSYNASPSSGSNATANTGAGGGGGSAFSGEVGDQPGGNGADGIAFISYAGTGSKATGGVITYNSGSNTTVHTFTSDGVFQIIPTRY
jgi:hypothetical protein